MTWDNSSMVHLDERKEELFFLHTHLSCERANAVPVQQPTTGRPIISTKP